MNKKVIGASIGIVAAAFIAVILVMALRQSSPQSSSTTGGTTQSGTSSAPASSFGESSADPTVRSGETSLAIRNFAFVPSEITVKKGTKVTWTNEDDAGHTVTADKEGANTPQSTLLDKGESYSFTFDTVGEFTYYCIPHPYMKAKVTVVE